MKIAEFEIYLNNLPKKIEKLTKDWAKGNIVKNIKQTHSQETEPDGTPWKKTKQSNPILTKTGFLKSQYKVQTRNTIQIQNKTEYAKFVNEERPIVPKDKVPREWLEQIKVYILKNLNK